MIMFRAFLACDFPQIPSMVQVSRHTELQPYPLAGIVRGPKPKGGRAEGSVPAAGGSMQFGQVTAMTSVWVCGAGYSADE